MVILAQSETTPTDPTDWLVLVDRYGLPLLVLIAGFLVARWLYKQSIADLRDERAKREELEATLRSDVIPALVTSTESIRRSLEQLEEHEKLSERLERLIERVEGIMLASARDRERPR